MPQKIILVKHAMPVLDADVPASSWRLGAEGERQAAALADRLEANAPYALVCSGEPKAVRTAEIVAARAGIDLRVVADLGEIDRPALPIVDAAEHERLNRPIFEQPGRAMLGNESADDALARFSAALHEEAERLGAGLNLVVITHGTVMALFAGAHSPVDPWKMWQRLQCGDSIEFELPGFRMSGVSSPDEVTVL
jgi:broad specificity phosphatase PhoE